MEVNLRDFADCHEYHGMMQQRPQLSIPTGVWLGSGPSTGKLLKEYPPWFDDRYQIAVCANKSHYAWHEVAKWTDRVFWIHLCPEEANVHADWYWDVPLGFLKLFSFSKRKVVEEKLRQHWGHDPERLEQEAARHVMIRLSHHPGCFNPLEYNGGLHAGTPDHTGHLRGTVTLQALHLLSLMGCKRIDAYGCELGFDYKNPVHFYDDEFKAEWAVKPGMMSDHWMSSAQYIRSLKRDFEQRGVEIRYCCDTNITKEPV